MFDPRSPYHRRRWHYDSDQPLSVPQLIARGSLDARTGGLLWLLVERHQSLIVSGPTDPTPGIGKTTTLNALLEFLPVDTTLVYTMGMYEDFDFVNDTLGDSTCVLANEVSDHLPIYMWGRTARTLLTLPENGYAVATSCHADTIDDVLRMLRGDLRLRPEDLARLGVIVNIGLVGHVWPLRRRFLTVHFLLPANVDAKAAGSASGEEAGEELLRLATWDEASDSFVPGDDAVYDRLAGHLGMARDELDAALARRAACLQALAAGQGAGLRPTRAAIEQLMGSEAAGSGAATIADEGAAE